MKITAISFVPPKGTEKNPALTPELCASVLARYSRSNEGLTTILSKVDLQDPEESIKRIFKFVDYGHASVGGLTGGIAVAIDNVTMWMAFKLFDVAPYCDGQESSTRYIEMVPQSLEDPEALGFTADEAKVMRAFGSTAIELYRKEYKRLDDLATLHPELIKFPENAKDVTKIRIRKNFALDRCRYFLPLFLRTNLAIVQTARAWTDTISGLASLPQPEAQHLASALIEAVRPYAPNLVKHARQKAGWTAYNAEEITEAARATMVSHSEMPIRVMVTSRGAPLAQDLSKRENRYDRIGWRSRLVPVEAVWDGMAIAEARDINRHRTGTRVFIASHKGLYLPAEILEGVEPAALAEFVAAHGEVLRMLSTRTHNGIAGALLPYGLVLGSQGTFYRTTTMDKFAYEAELRTGPGAHFRYADHYRQSIAELNQVLDVEDRDQIPVGEAEPE